VWGCVGIWLDMWKPGVWIVRWSSGWGSPGFVWVRLEWVGRVEWSGID